MGRGKKILIGCLVAAGIVVLAFVLVTFLAFRWLFTPGESFETHRLLDQDTVLFVDLALERENEAARALVRRLLEANNRNSLKNTDIPGPLRGFLQGLSNQKVTEDDIDEALPFSVGLTAQAGPDGMGAPVFIINLPNLGNMPRLVDMILSVASGTESELSLERHLDEKYYVFPESPIRFAVLGSDFAIALDDQAMRSAIERLARREHPEPVPPESPRLALLLGKAPGESVFRLAARAGAGTTVAEYLQAQAPAVSGALMAAFRDADEALLWARMDSDELLVGEILSDGPASENPPTGKMTLTYGKMDISLEQIETPGWSRAWRFELQGVEGLLPLLEEWLDDLDDDEGDLD